MENRDLISIIVPVYNVEKYIKYCVNSIINQKYKNLEIILVDDGSTDNSGNICDEYLQIDKRIKVIHKKNGGLADARNVGIQAATGSYLGFVDSDDYIHPDFYDILYNLIKENNADISECQFLRINVEDIDKAKNILDEQNSNKEMKASNTSNVEALMQLFGPRLKPYIKKVVVWNKLYKKSLFDDIKFPVGRLHEDEFTTFKVLYKCKNLISTNKILHGYMQTKNSIMRAEIKQKRIDDNLQAYEDAMYFFEKRALNQIVHKVQRRYLENCIELSGKVCKEQSQDRTEKLSNILNTFRKYYNNYFNEIKLDIEDNRELEIIEVIQNAFCDNSYDYINPVYWDELECIINKD